jgi:hypothetical protein
MVVHETASFACRRRSAATAAAVAYRSSVRLCPRTTVFNRRAAPAERGLTHSSFGNFGGPRSIDSAFSIYNIGMSRNTNTEQPQPGQQPELPPTHPEDPAQPEPPPLPPDAPQPTAPVEEPGTPKPAGDPPHPSRRGSSRTVYRTQMEEATRRDRHAGTRLEEEAASHVPAQPLDPRLVEIARAFRAKPFRRTCSYAAATRRPSPHRFASRA